MVEYIAGILACVVVVVLLIIGANYTEGASCEQKAVKMGVEHSYGLQQGCMIRVGGKWLPIENYRELGE